MKTFETTNVLYQTRFANHDNRFSLDTNPFFHYRVNNEKTEGTEKCKLTSGLVRVGLLVGFVALYYLASVMF